MIWIILQAISSIIMGAAMIYTMWENSKLERRILKLELKQQLREGLEEEMEEIKT